jgi:hypothetical protein
MKPEDYGNPNGYWSLKIKGLEITVTQMDIEARK